MKRMRVGLMAAPLGADKQSKKEVIIRGGALSERHSRVTMSRANEDTRVRLSRSRSPSDRLGPVYPPLMSTNRPGRLNIRNQKRNDMI